MTRRLELLVFVAGIGSLATEICASRLLAPYYGSSTIVWANVIGLVLASLSLGYWLGGRVADRRPEPSLLGAIVLAAALLVAVIPFVARPFLDHGRTEELHAGQHRGPRRRAGERMKDYRTVMELQHAGLSLIYPLISAEQMLSRTRWRLIRLC